MKDNKFKKGDYVRYIGTSYLSAKNQIFKVKAYRQFKSAPNYLHLEGWISGFKIFPDEVELLTIPAVDAIDPNYRKAVEQAIETALNSPKKEAVKAYAIYIDGKRVNTLDQLIVQRELLLINCVHIYLPSCGRLLQMGGIIRWKLD